MSDERPDDTPDGEPRAAEDTVEIPDDAAETILTVGDAIKFLEKNAA